MRVNRSMVMLCATLCVHASVLAAQRAEPIGMTRDGRNVVVSDASKTIARISRDSITSSFTVDGITVILRRNAANNVVAANLYLLGGVRQMTRKNAGIEWLLLLASERGTKHYPKNEIRRKMSLLGTEIVVAPSPDWTMCGVRATTETFDSTWAIFTDRVMYPALQPAEVELVRAPLLSSVRQQRDDPDALVSAIADSVAFAGHPYGTPFVGTERSLGSISAADLRAYHQSQFVKSRMLLVIVGDVSRAHIASLVRSTLGTLPVGDYTWSLPAPVITTAGEPAVIARELPTNYILGYFGGPRADARDYQALRVATSVLTGRMFGEIRARQNLTYDVHAPFLDRASTAGGLYVTTVSPDTTLKLMRYFVNELQTQTLSTEGLRRLELEFITDYFMDNETNASQADFLARSQLYQGDYRHADTFVDELRSVTPDAVRRAAQQYMRNIRFAYVGDPTQVDKALLMNF